MALQWFLAGGCNISPCKVDLNGYDSRWPQVLLSGWLHVTLWRWSTPLPLGGCGDHDAVAPSCTRQVEGTGITGEWKPTGHGNQWSWWFYLICYILIYIYTVNSFCTVCSFIFFFYCLHCCRVLCSVHFRNFLDIRNMTTCFTLMIGNLWFIDVLFPLVGWLIEGVVYPFTSR